MEYADFIVLVNLALVTVIYSSFIAPGLRKLSELKSDIANTEFPLLSNTSDSVEKVKKAGVILKKRITQYEDLYKETRHFLVFFYIILIIIFVVQVILLYLSNELTVPSLLRLGAALIVIILLIIALNLFITTPGKLRSIQWLRLHGIGSAYYRLLLSPTLEVNLPLMNLREDKTEVKFAMMAVVHLIGYSYLLTIQSVNGKKLYYASGGMVSSRSRFGVAQRGDGQESRTIQLTSAVRLKPKEYKVTFQFFEYPFPGTYAAHETTLNIDGREGGFEADSVKINLKDRGGSYEFTTDKKYKICSIEIQDEANSDIVNTLISSNRFIKFFKKSKVPFSLYDKEGLIGKEDINRAFARRNIFVSKARRYFTPKGRQRRDARLYDSI